MVRRRTKEIFKTKCSFFALRGRGGTTAGRPLADGAPHLCTAAPPGSYLCVRARAVRLTTAGDAAERRRTSGPWTDGMRLGGAEHCRRADDAGTPSHRCRSCGLRLICRSDWPGGWPGWWIGRLGGWPSGHCKRHAHTVHGQNRLVLRCTSLWGGRSSAVFLAKRDETRPLNSHMTSRGRNVFPEVLCQIILI